MPSGPAVITVSFFVCELTLPLRSLKRPYSNFHAVYCFLDYYLTLFNSVILTAPKFIFTKMPAYLGILPFQALQRTELSVEMVDAGS